MRFRSFLLIAAIACFITAAAATPGPLKLASPEGRIAVQIELPAPGPTGTPTWSAAYRGRLLLSRCRLSLTLKGEGDLLAGARLRSHRTRSEDHTVRVLFGKADHARDRFREERLSLESPRGRRVDVAFRCYEDAVALRYEIPKQPGLEQATVLDEGTSFALEGQPTAYVQYLENYRTSHEHAVSTVPYGEVRPDTLLDLPATFSWADGTYLALTEASLRHYAGMALMRPSSAAGAELACRLTPRDDRSKVVRPLPLETPWRVAMVGDRPGALLESNVLYCLNEPSAIGDTSWIRPGKITFSWWNGDVYDGKRGAPILSLETQKKYIDFCARSGIPFHAVIADETVTPWYHQSTRGVAPGPDTDVTRVRDDLDLAAIRRYADSKGIRLWTWVHQGALRGRVEEAFAAFEKLGWRGMMVDFFDHDDQESVEHAEAILRAAARHKILIHFHGIWKPTGRQRTFPNLMNHEAALNLEYLKWSGRCTPEHTLNLAFTRLIAGPMDYHLGGFRAVPRAQFRPHNVAPNVLGTRCHMLGLYVCLDNPTPMAADYPTAYEGQPGFDFLASVPTYWDETRVLEGRIGELLVTARRKGSAWYLGGISAGPAREITVPLSFLGPGAYEGALWKDGPDAARDPDQLTAQRLEGSAGAALRVRCGPDGGFVARFQPMARMR